MRSFFATSKAASSAAEKASMAPVSVAAWKPAVVTAAIVDDAREVLGRAVVAAPDFVARSHGMEADGAFGDLAVDTVGNAGFDQRVGQHSQRGRARDP